MGFKVTVHKNGAKHGEMHYSSEAVAVGMASKMKNAGAEASVARCNGTGCGCGTKTNRRRRTSTRAASDSMFALEATIRQTEAMLPAAAVRAAREESGWSSGVMAMASRSEMESYLRELRRALKANPRRNGTTSANLAASRSLVHRSGLMRNRRHRNGAAKIDAYVPAYLAVPRHGGNVILAQHPTDTMPMVVGIGNAPSPLHRKQYAGCKLSVVPASSIKRHRIGG